MFIGTSFVKPAAAFGNIEECVMSKRMCDLLVSFPSVAHLKFEGASSGAVLRPSAASEMRSEVVVITKVEI